MKTLVVYYSLSGRTRALARALAQHLAADSEEIRCARYRPGFWVYVKGSYDSAAGRLPAIDKPERDPSHYDLVVVGGPIWAGHAAPPVRAYLRQQAGRISNVAFVLAHRGSPPDKALQEMQACARVAPLDTLVVREADVESGTFKSAASSFAASLQERGAKVPVTQ
jgi:menaquinone-dependent protoporphyrinogen IX oxidase